MPVGFRGGEGEEAGFASQRPARPGNPRASSRGRSGSRESWFATSRRARCLACGLDPASQQLGDDGRRDETRERRGLLPVPARGSETPDCPSGSRTRIRASGTRDDTRLMSFRPIRAGPAQVDQHHREGQAGQERLQFLRRARFEPPDRLVVQPGAQLPDPVSQSFVEDHRDARQMPDTPGNLRPPPSDSPFRGTPVAGSTIRSLYRRHSSPSRRESGRSPDCFSAWPHAHEYDGHATRTCSGPRRRQSPRLHEGWDHTGRMCSSLSCRGSTVPGAPVMRSVPLAVLGKAMQSRMLVSPE